METSNRIAKLLRERLLGRRIPAVPLTIFLACVIGVAGGYGAVLFTVLIDTVSEWTVESVLATFKICFNTPRMALL